MKKFITLLLSFILILTASVPPVFADEFYTSSNDQILTVAEFERLFPSDYTYSTYYEDATGNNGYIKFDIINNKTYVELYSNNILSQRALSFIHIFGLTIVLHSGKRLVSKETKKA